MRTPVNSRVVYAVIYTAYKATIPDSEVQNTQLKFCRFQLVLLNLGQKGLKKVLLSLHPYETWHVLLYQKDT